MDIASPQAFQNLNTLNERLAHLTVSFGKFKLLSRLHNRYKMHANQWGFKDTA
jgi:hypothetical protein